MKTQILMAVMIFSCANTVHSGNYIISIDGRSAEMDLDKELKFSIAEGKEIAIILKQKEYFDFESTLFSMRHRNALKPSQTSLGEGVFQTLLITPSGTGIIVQEYMSMNPELIVDLMLKEITKEEVDYGYKYKETKIEKFIDGKKIRGKQAVTTYTGEEWTRSVMTYGGKDKGVIIMTMIEKGQYDSEQYVMSEFWESLKLSLD